MMRSWEKSIWMALVVLWLVSGVGRVNATECIDKQGTITAENLGCSGVKLTVTGHTAGYAVAYKWYKDDAEIAGATHDNYTATAAGTYYVTVDNSGSMGCVLASTNTVVLAEIPNCSEVFTGDVSTDWYDTGNWDVGLLPDAYIKVQIDKPCVVGENVTAAQAGSIKIHQGGDYTGSLTIGPKGRLIVEDSITLLESEAYKPTTASDLVIEANSTGNGVLVIGANEGKNKATVGFYTQNNVNRFIGTPFSDDENMEPFIGYSYSYDGASATTIWKTGTLVATADTVLQMSYNGSSNTENLFANSWIAPIDIAQFELSDFGGGVATIYIYDAGQYIVLPIASMQWMDPTIRVIESMQAFSVLATAANQSLTLDYDRLVRTSASQSSQAEAPTVMRLRTEGQSGYASVYVLARTGLTTGFDNGWDGYHIEGDAAAPQLYAITEGGKMSVNGVPGMEGTVLGFRPGEEDSQYTFTFDYEGEETWYLNDVQEQKSTQITALSSYSFWAYSEDDEARFVISQTPIQPTPTGVEQGVSGDKSTVRKLLIDHRLYIIRGGRLYSADGQLIR